MPTGYTHKVESGEVTELRDYMLICARAMGALIMMRDEPFDAPIPEKFEPQTKFYDEKIAVPTKRIGELSAMSADEAMTESLADNDRRRRDHREYEAAEQLRLERHLSMIAKVKAWQPPSRDHIEFKAFMIQQLEVSSQWLGNQRELPPMPTGEEWRQERLADFAKDLAYSTKARAEEIERTAQRQKWVDDLRSALPPVSTEVAA